MSYQLCNITGVGKLCLLGNQKGQKDAPTSALLPDYSLPGKKRPILPAKSPPVKSYVLMTCSFAGEVWLFLLVSSVASVKMLWLFFLSVPLGFLWLLKVVPFSQL